MSIKPTEASEPKSLDALKNTRNNYEKAAVLARVIMVVSFVATITLAILASIHGDNSHTWNPDTQTSFIIPGKEAEAALADKLFHAFIGTLVTMYVSGMVGVGCSIKSDKLEDEIKARKRKADITEAPPSVGPEGSIN